MELVEGLTLAERIQQGPVPVEEALAIAKQIADGVEAAHEKGIVHRDLKPGNVKIRTDGVVKVLDFGLAKLNPSAVVGLDPENSPTVTMGPTQAGVILGTAAYMSPEQARGKEVDKRADIWAFGCVLYEMVTGKRAFTGENTADILAAVVKTEPDLKRVPVKVRRLLRRCLEKDPKKRLRDIGDAWELLEDTSAPSGGATARERIRALRVTTPAAAVLVIIAVIGWAIAWRATRPPNRPLMRLDVYLGPEVALPTSGITHNVILSPDGAFGLRVGQSDAPLHAAAGSIQSYRTPWHG
jgi:eukaryotic-like serine/threonine-protein kinase